MKVFISHSSKDKWAARRISKEIEEVGATVFLDEKDIETGEFIDEAIHKNLKDCDEILILLSPASIKSHWVLIEVGGAKALEKKLVPILLYLGVNDIPAPISKHLTRDINSIEKYYDELKKRIKGGSPAAQQVIRRRRRPVRRVIPKSFHEGDLVKLPSTPRSDAERGDLPMLGWTEEMDEYCGREATITFVDDDNSVHLDIDDGENWWAFEWLEIIS